MNAHKELIKPQNGMLLIPVPEDMKEGSLFEVFIAVAQQAKAEKKKTGILAKYAGIAAHLSEEKKTKMLKELDDMRNEWERDF